VVSSLPFRLQLQVGTVDPSIQFHDFQEPLLLNAAFSLAALFSFWLLAPITAGLLPRGVIGRSLVAGIVAAVFMWPVEFFLLTAYVSRLTSDMAGRRPGFTISIPSMGRSR
jgi:hypothetical protein